MKKHYKNNKQDYSTTDNHSSSESYSYDVSRNDTKIKKSNTSRGNNKIRSIKQIVDKEVTKRLKKEVDTNITIADATIKYASATTFPSAPTSSDSKFIDSTAGMILPLSDLSLRKYELSGIPGVRYINVLSEYSFLRIFAKTGEIKLKDNNQTTDLAVNKVLLEAADRHSHTLRATLGKSSAREIRAAQLLFMNNTESITDATFSNSIKNVYANEYNISPYTWIMANLQTEFIYVTNFITQYFKIIANAQALQRKFPLHRDNIASLTNVMQKRDLTQIFTAILSTINMIKYNRHEYDKVNNMAGWGTPTQGVDSEIKHHQIKLRKIKLPEGVKLVSALGANDIITYDTTDLETDRDLDLFHQFMIATTNDENQDAKVATNTIRTFLRPLLGWASRIRPIVDMMNVMEDVLHQFNVPSSYAKEVVINADYRLISPIEDKPLLDAYLDFISTSRIDYDANNMYYINKTMAFSAPKLRSKLALSQHFYSYLPINNAFFDDIKRDRNFTNFKFQSMQLIVSDVPHFSAALATSAIPGIPGANVIMDESANIVKVNFYAKSTDTELIKQYSTSTGILSRIFSNVEVIVNTFTNVKQTGELEGVKTIYQSIITHPNYLIDVTDTWHLVTPVLEQDVLDNVLPYVDSFGS